MPTLKETIKHLTEDSATLTREESRATLHEMLSGEAFDVEIAAFLAVLAARGETVEELTGFAEAMRSISLPIPLTDAERSDLVDTCGTGGAGPTTSTFLPARRWWLRPREPALPSTEIAVSHRSADLPTFWRRLVSRLPCHRN